MADDSQTDDTTSPDATGYINAANNAARDAFGIGGAMDWAINNVVKAWSVIKGFNLSTVEPVFKFIGNAVRKVLELADEVAGPVAVFVLSTIFGSDAGDAFKAGGASGRGLQDGAVAVGASVLAAVFGPLTLDGSTALEPGLDRAEAYLGAVASMIMRGFIIDVAAEMIPEVDLKFVSELEETLIAGLGLGRVARTVLHPIVTTLVADPAQWAINLAYRPKLAGPDVAIDMWRRGTIDDAELDDILGRQGYGADHIDGLKVLHAKHLELGTLDELYAHDQVHDGDVLHELQLAGFDEESANRAWLARKLAHFTPINMREVDVLMAKLEAGLIGQGDFDAALAEIPLYPGVGQLLQNVARARLAHPRVQLSVAELLTAWDNNILTQSEVHDRLVRRGYSEDDATTILLTKLAIGQHKHEIAQQKAAVQAARAAQQEAAKAERAAAAAAKKAEADRERAQRAAELAQQRAQKDADAEQRRQFVVNAAETRRQLVAQQHAAEQISSDQLAVANAQIAADTAALVAHIDAQLVADDASFARQKLDLQRADREADLAEALANVDTAADIDANVRTLTVQAKLAANDAMLADKLADIETLYTDRAQILAADLENASAAVDVTVLPTGTERTASASTKIQQLDDALARKLTDIDAEYDDKQRMADAEHADGTITDKTYEVRSDTISTGRAQAKRSAQQSHDLAVAGLQSSGAATDATPIDAATAAKTKLQVHAQAAANKLAGDKVAAQLAAHQQHDKTALDLQAIQSQIGPITAAEAARRKLALHQADDAAKRKEQETETEIAKSTADAQASLQKAQATAAAAHQRLATLQTASGARESATAANLAAQAALAASQEQAREALERTIAAHQPQLPTSKPLASS